MNEQLKPAAQPFAAVDSVQLPDSKGSQSLSIFIYRKLSSQIRVWNFNIEVPSSVAGSQLFNFAGLCHATALCPIMSFCDYPEAGRMGICSGNHLRGG